MQDKLKTLKIVTVSILVFIVLLFAALTINLVKLAKVNARERQLEADLKRFEAAYREGEEELLEKQDKEYIIRRAREYHGMMGEGDTAFTSK